MTSPSIYDFSFFLPFSALSAFSFPFEDDEEVLATAAVKPGCCTSAAMIVISSGLPPLHFRPVREVEIRRREEEERRKKRNQGPFFFASLAKGEW